MDLFAREFLLPRPFARSLHLEGGLSASEIARRLGAPFDVVAQQLLDALLLPAVALVQEAPQPSRPLNARQAAAAQHRGQAFLLEAGPGTGKTQTFTARVDGLLEQGVDARRVLLLTYSNKAAGEMSDRIGRGCKDAAAAMWIGTFHAFGLDLIRRFHEELSLPADPRMMDRTEAVELLEDEFPRLDLRHHRNLVDPSQIIADILSAVSRAKDEVVDDATYTSLAQAMLDRAATAGEREAAERALEVARVYQAYEQLKRRACCIDFGDLVALPVRLLEHQPAVRAHLQAQYDHVLVDEYQDVNRSSVRLLTALRPDGTNLWVVGDAKQSIYRFRGASSFNMSRFGVEDFPGGERGVLTLNYRSVPEVVDAFSAFAATMRVRSSPSKLEATRSTQSFPLQLRLVKRAEEQATALADAVNEMREAGYAFRDQTILCTGNDKLAKLGADLERLGVPVLFLGSLFERPEVQDLLSLLSLFVDARAMGLLRLACWPEFELSLAEVDVVLSYLRRAKHEPAAWLNEEYPNGISANGLRSLHRLEEALRGFDSSASPWTLLTTVLLDRTRAAARIAASSVLEEQTRGIAIWQFLNFIRSQPASGVGLPIVRLLDRVRRLVRLGDDRDLRQLPAAAQSLDAVRLMTMHGAKGLEFSVVHLPGLNADTLPRSAPSPACPPPEGMIGGVLGPVLDALRLDHAEEQECLFYVAASRARDRLVIYAPTEKSNGHGRAVSPFVDRLGPSLIRSRAALLVDIDAASEEDNIELSVEGPLRFHASQLTLFESCPRRFFYTHVLQVGGRRSSTAFMRLHEAVEAVMTEILAGSVLAPVTDLNGRVDRALDDQGLGDHGYRHNFHTLALTMLRYLASSREGHSVELPPTLVVRLGGEEVVVRPDDVLVRPDGARVVRRVRTGHRRSDEAKDVGAAAFVLAVRQVFPDATVELLHLADAEAKSIELSAKELGNRRVKLEGYLQDVRRGRFPRNPSSRVCPKCPAFFACGPLPPGGLKKRFT